MTEGERYWADFRCNVEEDPGTLRELWLRPATLHDWSRLLRLVRDDYAFTFGSGDRALSMPADAGAIFAACANETRTLRVHVADGATINAHFFETDAIELDIAPWEITSAASLEAVFTFMRRLATSLGRDVIMTFEGGAAWSERYEHAIFRARPSVAEIAHSPVAWTTRAEPRGRFVDGVWMLDDEPK